MYKQTMNPSPVPAEAPVFYKETKKQKHSIYKENKTLKGNEPKVGEPKVKEPKFSEPKVRRVAKFLILIGSEQAAGVLAELDPQQVEEISKEIAHIRTIKPEEKDEILAEFHSLLLKPYSFSGSSRGGIEAARRILYAAKGPDKGEELLNKAIPESRENLFSFLDDFSKEQLVMLLKDESAQTTALILNRMPAKLCAGVLSAIPADQKADVIKRMAYQKEVAPQVLEQVSAALKEKVRHIAGDSKDIKIDGMQALAAILKTGDYSFGDRLINELEEENPEIGMSLKEKLYTLDDIVDAADRPIQDKLKTMTETDIAVLLKGRKTEFSEKILSNVSAGRRQLIREEMEISGAVPKHQCDSAARDFISWFRYARERGEILLNSDEDVVV